MGAKCKFYASLVPDEYIFEIWSTERHASQVSKKVSKKLLLFYLKRASRKIPITLYSILQLFYRPKNIFRDL